MKQLKYEEPPWPARIAGVIVISAVAGLFVMPPNASAGMFWKTQLYAQCIGFSTLAIFTLLYTLIPRADLSLNLRFVLLVLAVVLGYEAGSALAALVHGDPVKAGAVFRMTRPAIIIVTITAVIAVILGGARWRIALLTAAQAEAQQLATEAQLRLLQAQLEPHMLFNTLANLHSLIEVDPPRAQVMVEHLIEFMRTTLSSSRKEFVTVQEEFKLISTYLELMAVRMESRLSFKLELPQELEQARIPAMLLQPLAENAVKHGLEPKVEGGTILIRAESADGFLLLSVKDTGRGLSENMNDKSYGITHVRERLKVLYGDKASLSIEAVKPSGVLANVKVPL